MNFDRIKSLLLLQKIYGTDGFYFEKPLLIKKHLSLENLDENHHNNTKNDKTGKSVKSKEQLLEKIKKDVVSCKKCNLYKTRVNVVFGEGNVDAELMFIGEGPGFDEDKQGRPFVGRAGELLTRIITAMKLSREMVYITNIVKCHPLRVPDPNLRNNDRPPNDVEINTCLPYLKKQIEIIRPKVICCLGSTSARVLTKNDLPITELRGKILNYDEIPDIKIVATYHPAALLRNPSLKAYVWKDMKLIMKILGIN